VDAFFPAYHSSTGMMCGWESWVPNAAPPTDRCDRHARGRRRSLAHRHQRTRGRRHRRAAVSRPAALAAAPQSVATIYDGDLKSTDPPHALPRAGSYTGEAVIDSPGTP